MSGTDRSDKDATRSEGDLQILGRLWRRYFRKQWGLLLGVLVALVASAAAQAGAPALIARAIDRAITEGNSAGLTTLMLLLGGVYLVGFLALMAQRYLMGVAAQ